MNTVRTDNTMGTTTPISSPIPAGELTFDHLESTVPAELVTAGLAGVSNVPYWLDSSQRPEALPALEGHITTDLLVVGGGYCGLWTALMAKERDPNRKVVLLEGHTVGWAASGRNGGFCEASLVHGESNGEAHLPKENKRLGELGMENLAEIAEAIERYGIDCDFTTNGVLNVATEPHQVDWVREEADNHPDMPFLDRDEVREHINSPVFHAGFWDKDGGALVNPAKLAWGLRKVCLELGVKIYEHSLATSLEATATDSVTVGTAAGTVRAAHVALATNVFPSLLKRHHLFTVPVYDYALMTEPLTEEQREAIGWKNETGLADMNNRFHYSRPTTDENGGWRILFGGYDAEYYFGGKVKPQYDNHESTYRKLAAHFYGTFPQLTGVKFSHAWGGAIDSCSRFFSFFDTSHHGRVAYCAGFTGLGVGATRFGANVMLDLLSGVKTERTELEMVKKKPLPFPPEPVAWLGVKLMTRALAKADRNEGKRGPFLRTMDAIGMGFDS
ncbi:FAD-dependent oxidoreductase [Paeniglutamicibacter cryotolerans]|uniref:Glycine/D-amino acid oxidase-like deaminating enzyme n=2 Tax=Paeniglutamicibacter cryotolerans TaxID=670079 RepID=A0A839QIK6_9MICC|nr:glycine/D-amino acid oxidase-like deaminating enzyme [Paeniglutamicibacter cryotolerans]